MVDTRQLLEEAVRSLIHRGIVTMDAQGAPVVDKPVQAAVTACVYPEQMVSLSYTDAGQPQQGYFYRAQDLSVTHSFPEQGFSELRIGSASDMGLEVVNGLFRALQPSSWRSQSYPLMQYWLAKAQRLSENQFDAAVGVLTDAGVAGDDARALASVFRAPALKLVLQCFYQIQPIPEQRVLTVLADGGSCWLIGADALDTKTILVQAMPPGDALHAIHEAYNPFAQPQPSVRY